MTDEQEPRAEGFMNVWQHYAELTTYLNGGVRTYYQGRDSEKHAFGLEAKAKLAALRQAVLESYGEPRILFAILDTRHMNPRKPVRIYFPTTDEVKDAIIVPAGRAKVPRHATEVPDWEVSPYLVDRVARVLLYALPDQEREDLWTSDMPSWEVNGKGRHDMYTDMFLAE